MLNLEPSIAITHNFVTDQNLLSVMSMLRAPSAGCDSPESCKGDKMGDVPLWVAMGGVVENVPRAAPTTPPDLTSTQQCCRCADLRADLVNRLETEMELRFPGRIDRLKASQSRDRERKTDLWSGLVKSQPDDRHSQGGDNGGPTTFRFGF